MRTKLVSVWDHFKMCASNDVLRWVMIQPEHGFGFVGPHQQGAECDPLESRLLRIRPKPCNSPEIFTHAQWQDSYCKFAQD